MRIAIVGTRAPRDEMYNLLKEWARIITAKGHIVTTGAADGCDDAAMQGADPSKLHVFLPWATYNRNRVPIGAQITVYNPVLHPKWGASVHKYHPAALALSRGPFALHARNYGIVEYVNAVIALPKSLSDLGGTGQAVRISLGEGIKLFNLLSPGVLEECAVWIDSI